MHFVTQCLVLFLGGVLCSAGMVLLHVEHDILSIGIEFSLWAIPWWVLASCGVCSVLVGLLTPFTDKYFSSKPNIQVSLSTFVRQLIVFVGLALASVKFPFENNAEMSITLAFIAILVWWIGDRSRIGLLLSLVHTLIGTACVQALALLGFYRYADADFAGVRSWLPSLMFAGCVCAGSLGRVLILGDSRAKSQ